MFENIFMLLAINVSVYGCDKISFMEIGEFTVKFDKISACTKQFHLKTLQVNGVRLILRSGTEYGSKRLDVKRSFRERKK